MTGPADNPLPRADAAFHALCESAPIGIFLTDSQGSSLYANPFLLRNAGLSLEQALGRGWLQVVHPDDLPSVVETISAALRERTSFEKEFRILTPQGRQRWIAVKTDWLPPRDDSPLGQVGVVQDITELKQVSEALRRQALVFNSINDGVIITDAQNLIADWNAGAERVFGYRADEVRGRCPEVLNRSGEGSLITKTLHEGIRREGHWHGEMAFVRKDGSEGTAEVFIVPIPSEDGGFHGTISVNRDITAKKQAEAQKASLEAQLRHAQKMDAVGTLASGIAHEFNNLLTAIFGYVELAKGEIPRNASARWSLEMVEQAARQARGVVSSLLTFTQKSVACKAPINLVPSVLQTVRLLHRFLPPSIEITGELRPDPETWVNADVSQLQQVWINLALNARDAMPNGGRLRIALSRQPIARSGGSRSPGVRPGVATVVVEDTGIGMTPETRARIFEPFFTTKPRGEGTGLGLSVVHAIVTDHGGTIDVQSEPGRGATFTIELPCCPPPAEIPRNAEPVVGRGQTILVVEDNEHVRSIMSSFLRSRGYEALPAVDGRDALSILSDRAAAVQLIVLDLDLSAAGELSVLDACRRHHPGLPILIVTGRVDLCSEGDLRKQDRVLRKPFQMPRLAETIAEMLRAPSQEEGHDL